MKHISRQKHSSKMKALEHQFIEMDLLKNPFWFHDLRNWLKKKTTQPWENKEKNTELSGIICRYSKNDFCCKLISSSAQYDLL